MNVAFALAAAASVALAAPVAATPLAPASASSADCVVTEGAFSWGFKESFRAYISGSIANGEWTTEGGIDYVTPSFGSDALSGDLQLDTVSGELAVDGSMRFTGHDGILDTTIADPVLQFDGSDRLVIVVDVTGTTQDFVEVSALDVAFVTGDLSAAEWRVDGDLLVIDQVPLVLTDEGAEAFGTYPAGEAFDPLNLRLTTTPDCAEQAIAARQGGSGLLVSLLVVGAVVLAVAGSVLVHLRLRAAKRRAAARRDNYSPGA